MSSQAIFTQGAAPATPGAGLSTLYVKADTKLYLKNDSGTEFGPLGASSAIDNSINDFRLTLTTAVPVTTADVTGATTIFCCPYKGMNIALYDGANWNQRSSTQFSIALGTLTSSLPYDVFCFDNSTVPTLEILAWSNSTARATALVYQDGVLVKSGVTTRRYMGTFFTTSTTQTEDSVANRYLYNYSNRVARVMQRFESTASWNYTLATLRQANASTSNQINFIQGVAEDAVTARVLGVFTNTSACTAQVGIGLDSTTTNTAAVFMGTGSSSFAVGVMADYIGTPAIGKHFLAWLESSVATGTTTFYGNGTLAAGAVAKSGIQGSMQG